MPKGTEQRIKLITLMRMFQQETDDEHDLSLAEITERLMEKGISADRKTLYSDFDQLRKMGFDIITEKRGRVTYYHLGARDFELPELKLLVDAVQASRFITDKKSAELIEKLENLTSRPLAAQLQRQVLISGRIKSMNESIYYTVDMLNEAINNDVQIRFQYFQWNVQKQPELRRDGAVYQVSPWCLMWDNQNYYLMAYDDGEDRFKHYRVDKMLHLEVTDVPRCGKEQFDEIDVARYGQTLFGMFGGEEMDVVLKASNDLANVMIDRFGPDARVAPVDEAHFEIRVRVAVSPQFFGWVLGLGEGVEITAPYPVRKQMMALLERMNALYQ